MRHRPQGFCAGGVSTSGGLGFGFGGSGAGPGAGRTSIGGGSGAACWVTAQADAWLAVEARVPAQAAAAARSQPSAADDADRGRAAARRPVAGSAARCPAQRAKAMPPSRRRQRRFDRRRLAALDRIEPACFAIDRAHRKPGRQRGHVDRPVHRIGRSRGEQLNLRTAGRRADRGRCEAGANVGLIGRDVVAAGHDGARALRLQRGGVDAKPPVTDDEGKFR